MNEGDIVAQSSGSGQFAIVKILKIDTWPDQTLSYHCLCYQPVAQIPSIDEISTLPVMTMHAPFAAQAIDTGQRIGNRPVTVDELEGFYVYLKMTDFGRYAREAGFNADVELPKAKEFYLRGNELGELNRFAEAIDAYTSALDIFPIFMEALDNRGLTYMDVGDLRPAIQDFQTSLQYHGENPVPLFSLGECYLKLGEKEAARKCFARGAELWPDKAQFKLFLQKTQDSVVQPVAPSQSPETTSGKKPWWKFGRA
jgi:tetratricopeptide (TPR) repeat protein